MTAAYTGSEDVRNTGKKAVTYSDGEALDPAHVAGVVDIMKDLAAPIPWMEGDLMMIDNHQILHSRSPNFVAPRKIQAFLGTFCSY